MSNSMRSGSPNSASSYSHDPLSDLRLIRPFSRRMLERGFEVEVIPGTIMGDILGIVGVLVVTVAFGGRDVDQIPFRDPGFDRRARQGARIDRHSPDIVALEGPALVEL